MSENPVMDVKPKCESCGKGFNSGEELNARKDSDHNALFSPEQERSNASEYQQRHCYVLSRRKQC